MTYQISRNGQTYGPYTLEDLQRYVASGNVLPTDMAKSDEMPDWVPVSQLLAGSGAIPEAAAPAFSSPGFANPSYTAPAAYPDPAYGAPAVYNPAALAASPYPDCPNLHWGLYLLFAVLTCGLFSKVFTVVQAAWLKRVQPNSTAIFFYIGCYVLWLFNTIHSWSLGMNIWMSMARHNNYMMPTGGMIGSRMLSLLYWVLLITTRFIMRGSLQEHFNTVEPVGLDLNPVMTFFFGGVYFQSQLNRIAAAKQAARFGAPRAY